MIAGAEKNTAGCARRRIGKALEDSGSNPDISTRRAAVFADLRSASRRPAVVSRGTPRTPMQRRPRSSNEDRGRLVISPGGTPTPDPQSGGAGAPPGCVATTLFFGEDHVALSYPWERSVPARRVRLRDACDLNEARCLRGLGPFHHRRAGSPRGR